MKVRKVYLDGDSPAIRRLCSKDKRLAKAIMAIGAIDYDVYEDEYEFLIWQIVGQMISGKNGNIWKNDVFWFGGV